MAIRAKTKDATHAIISPMNQKIKDLYQKHRNFILYAVFGTISTGVDFCIFWILKNLLPYQVANAISFHAGILCSFLLNKNINYKVENRILIRFLVFYLVQLLGLGVSSLTLNLLIESLGFNALLAKGCSVLTVALILFLLDNFITFRKKDS